MASIAIETRRRRRLHDRQLPYVSCPYCKHTWGPWLGISIQPCQCCKRPLFRTRAISPIARPPQVSGLLDTINAAQGLIGAGAICACILGWISAHMLGLTIAIAMFVAATAHTTDGVLGVQTRIVRVFERLQMGKSARPIAVVKVGMGLFAFALSFSGIVAFLTFSH